MVAVDPSMDVLNGLLRGELAAQETYAHAVEKIDEEGIRAVLRRIRVEHAQAVQALEEHIRYFGGEPVRDSGPWGSFAHVVEGAARLLGVMPTLRALQEGERQGKEDYERVLEGDTLPPECRGLVRNSLLPQTQAHVESLERLLGL
jgi:uncharacterized protein (TIGR02284 family)